MEYGGFYYAVVMFLFYSILGALLYVAGDVLGKYWALNDSPWFFWGGLLLYSLGGASMFYAIREDSLTMALLVMPPIAIVLSSLAGYFLFEERISPVQYLAAVVIILAVCVLLWNPKFTG